MPNGTLLGFKRRSRIERRSRKMALRRFQRRGRNKRK